MNKFWKSTIAAVILIGLYVVTYRYAGPEYAQGMAFVIILLSFADLEEKLK
jgi:dolichol kinase